MKKERLRLLKYFGLLFLAIYSVCNIIETIIYNIINCIATKEIFSKNFEEYGTTVQEVSTKVGKIFKDLYSYIATQHINTLIFSILFALIIAIVIFLIKDKSKNNIKVIVLGSIDAILAIIVFKYYIINEYYNIYGFWNEYIIVLALTILVLIIIILKNKKEEVKQNKDIK